MIWYNDYDHDNGENDYINADDDQNNDGNNYDDNDIDNHSIMITI